MQHDTRLVSEPRILDEHQIFATEAPRYLAAGRNGRPVHHLTILRWIRCGIRRVKLEALRLGHRWVTSTEALERFTARLTASQETPAQEIRPPAARRREFERATQLAAAEGL
jgi:hypothetical protein